MNGRPVLALVARVAAVGVLILLAGCSSRTPADPPEYGSPFVVRPGDQLRITVWPDEELGGTYAIEDTGLVYLPVLGAVPVAGSTLEEVRTDLRERYQVELKSPIVTVTPVFRISVWGAVNRPGLYVVDPTHTLFDILIMAGGFTGNADQDDVRILRDGRPIAVDAKSALRAGEQGDLALELRSGDRIIVPNKPWTQNLFRISLSALNFAVAVVALGDRFLW